MTKHQARNYISNKIRDGELPAAKTLFCVDCGNPAKDYDHYLGYDEENYKVVEPVCRGCHRKREGKRGTCYPCWKHRAMSCVHGERSQRQCKICRRQANNLAAAKHRQKLMMMSY